jgi:hypothetical protein
MNTADIMKVLEDDAAKRRELNDTSKWTDKQLCEKIIFILDKRLDASQKNCSYGDDYAGITFEFAKALLETFDNNSTKVNTDMILDYAVEVFLSEICNFCGCGCNERLLRYILNFLECFNYDNEGLMLDKKLFDKGFSHPLMSDDDMWVAYEFLAKWVDSIGLSDHGTSVYSSWLTDEGLAWREVLRRVCKEE